MATLNTLRTKFGVVLSAVIAFALLAFVFSLKAEMGFSGNDPIVAKINGQDVTYTQYYDAYESIQRQSGIEEIDEQQADMIYAATWQSLITEHLMLPGIESMGFGVGERERVAMIRGEVPTQAFYSAFANPNTGAYDITMLNNFLFMSQGDPQSEAIWQSITSQAREERIITKYAGLVNAGVNLNALEIAEGVDGANKSFDGRWAVKRYSSVDDSQVTVSDAEVKKFYDDHKEQYKRQATRTISYAEFVVEPSAADLAALESKAMALAVDFEKAADIRQFVRESRAGSVASNYVGASAMSAAEAEVLDAGKMYGPESDGQSWIISRVENSVYASDTLSLRHIVLSYTDQQLADSLYTALRKASDDDFATAAMVHSTYTQTSQSGGDVGAVPFSAFVDEFAEALAPTRVGDVIKLESGDMIQLIRVYKAGPRAKYYRVATLEVPIVSSQETRTAAHNAAGLFASDAKGSGETFKSAASDASVSSHSVDLTSAVRTIAAVPGSSEVVRWAHKAKVGDMSEIFKVDDGYVVAMLTAINDSEYSKLSEVESAIRQGLILDKKFEKISADVSGSTFEAKVESLGGESNEFNGVNYNSYYISGAGVEPRLVGAITSASKGAVSAPIKGLSGVYVFVVDGENDSDEPQTADAEKLRAEMMYQQMTQQMLFATLESMGDIKDLRGDVL